MGDVGFLGGTSTDGITQAEFSIDGSIDNFEMDLLEVLLPGAIFSPFGNGCAGSAGVLQLSSAGTPQLGQSFQVTVSGVPGAGAMLVGGSNTVFGPLMLPFDFTSIGAPGCSLLVSPDILQNVTSMGNQVTWSVSLPCVNQLNGAMFFTQLLSLDMTANPLGVALSNGGQSVIGF